MIGNENKLEIQLADGWYRGSIGCWGLTNVFGRQTKLLCQLEINYEDGTIETISSDDTFKWSNDGPIRFADLKDGELFDASKTPSYQNNARETVESVIPTASNNVAVREKEVLQLLYLQLQVAKEFLILVRILQASLLFQIKR